MALLGMGVPPGPYIAGGGGGGGAPGKLIFFLTWCLSLSLVAILVRNHKKIA